jgi:hypothetical protein
VPGRFGVGGDAFFEVSGLADVEDIAACIEHPVNARSLVEPAQVVANDRVPGAPGFSRSAVLDEAAGGVDRPVRDAIRIAHG